jgi:TonB family protein
MRIRLIAVATLVATLLLSLEGRAQLADVRPPTLIQDESPAFPEAALRDGITAPTTVMLRLVVDEHGVVTQAEVEAPTGHGFDEAATAAAKKLRFAPATRDGIPIASRIRFRFVFTPPPTPALAPVAPVATPAPTETQSPPTSDAEPPPPAEVRVVGSAHAVEVAKRSMGADEMQHLPGARGDALASIEAMPGVGRAPPNSGLLIFRGSGPNDTNVFVDGTGINIAYHLGGLSSVVPTDVLEKLDFYPGNYGSEYGRGMGGVVALGVRAPRDDGHYHGLAQADLIEGRALAEGPLAGGWRFLVAARRSTVDLWLDPILSGNHAPTLAPHYYDGQLELVKDIDSRRSLRLLFFGYDDRISFFQGSNADTVELAGNAAEHFAFGAAQLRYIDRYAMSGELHLMASVGRDIQQRTAGVYYYDLGQTPINLRADASQRVLDGFRIEPGLDIVYTPYAGSGRFPALSSPDIPTGGPAVLPLQTTASGARFEPGAYVQAVVQPWWGSRTVPSVRADYDSATHALDIAPRLSLRQDVRASPHRTTLKAALGSYFQPPQIVEVVPVFGQRGLRSSRSFQGDTGVEQAITEHVTLSLDVFYKRMDRLVVPGARSSGEGRAYGAEWLLRYEPDSRFYGWIAYTLSRSERRDSASTPFYLFDFDQPSNLSVVGSYRIDDHWRVGTRFRYTSGNPYTPLGTGALDAASGTYSSTIPLLPNGARLPSFHELDVRVDRSWDLGAGVRLTAYLDVENVYDYQAPTGIAYSFDFAKNDYARGLPILPSIGLRGEL